MTMKTRGGAANRTMKNGRFSRPTPAVRAIPGASQSGAPRARRIEGLRQRRDGDDKPEDLESVMVDAAGRELHVRHAAQRDRDHRGNLVGFAEENAPGIGGGAIQSDEGQRRKSDPRRALGRLGRKDQAEGVNQRGKDGVDDARPVRQHAQRRVEPVRDEVPPALPGEEIAGLDHAHGVVGVIENAGLPHRRQLRMIEGEGKGDRAQDREPEDKTPLISSADLRTRGESRRCVGQRALQRRVLTREDEGKRLKSC